MAKLTITAGKPALDGEYELDLSLGFTKTEYYLMKKQVGILIDDLAPGARIDANVLTAWGLVALHRAEKDHLFPVFMETRDDQTEWAFDDAEVEEDDAGPPEVSAEDASGTPSATGSSGEPTRNGSDGSPEITRRPTGTRPSDIGSISGQAISAI